MHLSREIMNRSVNEQQINKLINYLIKTPNCCWFQLFRSEDLMLFFIIYVGKLHIFPLENLPESFAPILTRKNL